MKRLPFLLLFSITLVLSCNPSVTSVEEEACVDGTPVDQLNCRVGFHEWALVSVTSDKARPTDDGGSTRTWLEFQPECYAGSRLNLPGFASASNGDVVTFYDIANPTPPCVGDLASNFNTDVEFNTAEILLVEEASLFLYGIPFEDTSAFYETWYDIRVETGESLKFRVDKTLDSIDYRLNIEMRPVD